MPNLAPGSVFAGHRIEGVAGRGGMGTVYRATHLALDHLVALKVISPELADDEGFRERFKSESRVAVSIRHPNVVPIHHAGEEGGLLFVTMDLIDGPDLRRLLSAEGPLEPERAAALLAPLAAALDAAHSRGLVHRDVKPGNILIDPRGAAEHVYLTDFGLTKRIDADSAASALTSTGAFVGTLDYVAPEQIRGDRLDARTDVYALGCVLYEALTGSPPFADRSENVAKIYAHLQDEPEPLPEAVPAAVETAIRRAIAKDSADRYPSAGDLARAVDAAVAGEVVAEQERNVGVGAAAPTEAFDAPSATGEAHASAPTEQAELRPQAEGVDTVEQPAGPPPPAESLSAPGSGGASGASSRALARRRRRLAIGVAGLAGILAAVIAALLLGGGNGGDGDPVLTDPAMVGRPIEVGGMPVGIAQSGGTVLVAGRESGELTPIDVASHAAGPSVEVGGGPEAVVAADGTFSVSLSDEDTVVTVDAAGEPTGSPISVGATPRGLALADGALWVALAGSGEVARVPVGDGATTPDLEVAVGEEPYGVALGGGQVWVSNRASGTISRFPESGGSDSQPEPETIEVGRSPKGVAYLDGAAWVANTDSGTVARIGRDADAADPDPVQLGGKPRDVAAGFGFIWVTNEDGRVSRIDPQTRAVADAALPGSPENIAIGSDSVWVTTGGGGDVVEVDPGI